MNFNLSRDQKELIENFRVFGTEVFTPESVKRWCIDQGLPDEVVQGFAEVYFTACENGEKKGRRGLDLMSNALILEELSRCAGSTLPFQHDFFNLEIIERFGGSSMLEDILYQYCHAGRLMFAVAISEPDAGSDVMGIKTTTRTVGGKVLLNGEKSYVFNGEYSPYILVAAIDADDDTPSRHPHLGMWLIPRSLEGVWAYPIEKAGQSMVPFASLKLMDVELDPSFRLDAEKASFPALFELLDSGRVFIGATCLGLARAAMEDAVEAASSRRRFGRRIADFQQISQMLTDMEVRIRAMRALVYQAAWEIDNGMPGGHLSATLMKRYVPQAATSVASDAMQILGSVGYTEQSRVARIWRDCRGNQIAEGTDQIMVRIASPLVLERYRDCC